MSLQSWLKSHGTKVLGGIAGTIGAMSTTGVIPARYLPWALTIMGLATFWRGFVNDSNGNPS